MKNMVYMRGRDAVIEVWDYVAHCKRDCWIDAADVERVSVFRAAWYACPARKSSSKWYALGRQWTATEGKSKTIMFHRFLLGVTDPDVEVHHKDNDGLNNRRGNLELLDHKRNMRERFPDRDWAKRDAAEALAKLYRAERLIARQVQDQFQVTRVHMHSIRVRDSASFIRSKPAAAYHQAIEIAGIKSLGQLKQEWPKKSSQWGVFRNGSKW
jgi:hypothetical protein